MLRVLMQPINFYVLVLIFFLTGEMQGASSELIFNRAMSSILKLLMSLSIFLIPYLMIRARTQVEFPKQVSWAEVAAVAIVILAGLGSVLSEISNDGAIVYAQGIAKWFGAIAAMFLIWVSSWRLFSEKVFKFENPVIGQVGSYFIVMLALVTYPLIYSRTKETIRT
tara:strand:+ start:377 stop:877 length:501 start_codon:yes stop_codon:yes gene_type:complete